MKAVMFGLLSFVTVALAWGIYYLKPGFEKATTVAAYRAAYTHPVFWLIAVAVSAVCFFLAR